MPATTSWADKLKIANEGAVKLQPLELGEKNFEVAKAEVRQSAASGNSYLSIQAKVIDGPQANSRVFYRLFPESNKSRPLAEVVRFVQAVGISTDWLASSNPSLEEMASAFQGRKFTAEVYIEDDARIDDYTGAPQRSIRNPKPQGAAEPAPQDTASSSPSFGQSVPGQSFPNTPTTPPAPAEDPWSAAKTSEPPF